MATNTKKKAVTKKVTKVNKAVSNKVTITAAQARTLQAALAKNGKNYKFLDTKLAALTA